MWRVKKTACKSNKWQKRSDKTKREISRDRGIYFAPSRRTVPNHCKDNTFSFWTQSSGSNLRMYKASNTARCNKDLPRDKTENTSSEYHSRQLALPDRWHLIAEVPFPWPDDLAVVTSDPAACESLPLRPASLQFRLPRYRFPDPTTWPLSRPILPLASLSHYALQFRLPRSTSVSASLRAL